MLHLPLRAPIFNLIFTLRAFTPRHHNNALVIQSRDDFFPLCNLDQSFIVRLLCALEHVFLNRLKEFWDGLGDICKRKRVLDAGVSTHGERLFFLEVEGTNFEAERNALPQTNQYDRLTQGK